jgi:homospermidine synthase
MYVMHDDIFLPEVLLTIQVYRGLIISFDHFLVILECTHQGVDGCKTLLRRQPLRFNSSFLRHENFKHALGQLVREFTRQVHICGVSSWDVCLSNIQRFARHYGISQTFLHKR